VLFVAGQPSQQDVDAIASPFAATMLEALPCGDAPALHRLFPSASPEAADLLSRLLQVRLVMIIKALTGMQHGPQGQIAALASWSRYLAAKRQGMGEREDMEWQDIGELAWV
jgi:hypothetical protein